MKDMVTASLTKARISVREVGVALIRNPESLNEIKSKYRNGGTEKRLRSYMMPEYQREIIDMLETDTGKSKADVVRTIIDEWIEVNLRECNGS